MCIANFKFQHSYAWQNTHTVVDPVCSIQKPRCKIFSILCGPRTLGKKHYQAYAFVDAHIYEGYSKNNTSYFISLIHNARGRCWWYGSRGWTFPAIFRSMLLQCDRWQQRGSLTEWCLAWKCVWNKGVSLNFSMQKKLHHYHSLMLAERLRRPNSACDHSEAVGGVFQQWQQ